MKVGDYVRIKYQGINKIDDYYEDLKKFSLQKMIRDDYGEMTDILDENDVIKSSLNIIDLFEEYDLVVIEYYSLRYKERVTRLFEVDYKDKEFMTLKNAYCDFMLRNNEFNDKDKKLKPIIKSIVTKEQFENMEYRIGE